MDKTEMTNRLKDSVYEFEGLLELLGLRPEKEAELMPLLSRRFADMTEAFASLQESVDSHDAQEFRDSRDSQDSRESRDSQDPQDSQESPCSPAAEPQQPSPVRKAPAFCLNDRFRFRRSVFGGDESLFDRVCARVSEMKDYEEAEEYFYGELGLEPESNDVEDFMTIIREYLSK